MHLVISYASTLSEASAQALSSLRLPHLERVLSSWNGEATVGDADEYSLSPPHERAVAALRGWPVRDGLLPFAAAAAREDGIEVPADNGRGWGLSTPVHWQVGAQGVRMSDPAGLQLDVAESCALHEALRPLFEELGWTWHWGAPLRWYAAHASLAETPTASLDRAIGRQVDLWLKADTSSRTVRRLQNEAQMLLHVHPVNEAREARGLQPVNSFWLSGTGPVPPVAPLHKGTVVDDRLRPPALAGDWAAWAEAWTALDAGRVLDLLQAPPELAPRLTLCGERTARTWRREHRPWWRTVFAPRRASLTSTLESL